MAEDYYKVLGVGRDATPEQIQKAYRDLARKYHPDLHPDDKGAKKKFQQLQTAFEVLNDKSKRELYDRYGSAYESVGAGRAPGGASWEQGPPGTSGFEEVDLGEIFGNRFEGGSSFSDLFGKFTQQAGQGRGRTRESRGHDLAVDLEIPFTTAVTGGEVKVNIPMAGGNVKTLDVKIPAGVEDGQRIRLRGQGEPGFRGGPPGDLLVTLNVLPHPFFQRRGQHLDVKLPVTLAEAALGAKVDVPTPKGTISLRIPPGTSSGTKLRVKGHGVPAKNGSAGDLYAEVQIAIPKTIDDESRELIKKLDEIWSRQGVINPRRDLRW